MKYSKLIAIGLLFCVAQANANVAQFAKAVTKQSPRIYQVAKQYGLKATDLAAKAGKNNFSAATEADIALARRLYYTNSAKGFARNNSKLLVGAAATGAGLTGLYVYNKFNQAQEVAQPVETAPVVELPNEIQPEVSLVTEITPEVVAQESNPSYIQVAKDWTKWAYEGAKNSTVNSASAALNGAKYYGSQALTASNNYVVAPVCGYAKAGANSAYNAGLVAKDATVNAAYASANGAKGLAVCGYNSAVNAYGYAKNATVNGASAALNGAKYYGSQALTAGNDYVVAPVCGYTKAGANSAYNAGLIAKNATVNAAYATANGAKGLAVSGYNSAANVCSYAKDATVNGASAALNGAKYYGSQALIAGNDYMVAPTCKGFAKAGELGNAYVVNPSAVALAAAANKAKPAYEVSKDFAQKRLAIAATNVQLLKDAAKSGYSKVAEQFKQAKPGSIFTEIENNSDRIS